MLNVYASKYLAYTHIHTHHTHIYIHTYTHTNIHTYASMYIIALQQQRSDTDKGSLPNGDIMNDRNNDSSADENGFSDYHWEKYRELWYLSV